MKKLFLIASFVLVSYNVHANDCFCLYNGGEMPKQFCKGTCYPIEEVIETSGNCYCKMNIVEIEGKKYTVYGHSCRGDNNCSFDPILDSFHEKYPEVPGEFRFQ